ncbi:hypothetical protein AURDEDRAFT_169752 [Auricularia subglabra TFB-10046 SS5]|nr:hypothetical protein AURDEDRAFT_169752 [Auricularia subglabra TFB-10046 SS5]
MAGLGIHACAGIVLSSYIARVTQADLDEKRKRATAYLHDEVQRVRELSASERDRETHLRCSEQRRAAALEYETREREREPAGSPTRLEAHAVLVDEEGESEGAAAPDEEEEWFDGEADDWQLFLIQPVAETPPDSNANVYEQLLSAVLATGPAGEDVPFAVEREGNAIRIPKATGPRCYDLRQYLPPSPLSFCFIDASVPARRHRRHPVHHRLSPMFASIRQPHTSLPPRRCPHRDHLSTPVDTLRLVADIRRLPSLSPPMPAAAGRRPPPIAEPYTLDLCSAPRLAP